MCCPATSAMTSSRDTSLGVRFPGVLVYDGQGFLVRKSQNITSALELSGARICVTAETADEQGISDYFAGLKMPIELMKFAKWSDAVMAYANKSCMVLSADISTLALARQELADSADHIILAGNGRPAADRTSGATGGRRVVQHRALDPLRADRRRRTRHQLPPLSTLRAIPTAAMCAAFSGSTRTSVSPSVSTPTGRSAIIRQVGNYGELFERHLGQKSPLKLERRLNNLSGNGGLHYAPPFR